MVPGAGLTRPVDAGPADPGLAAGAGYHIGFLATAGLVAMATLAAWRTRATSTGGQET